jgi:glucose/arabinose dehydrogenase
VDLGHAPDGNAQNTSTILGKILRIDVNRQSDNKAYGIPEDNPFVGKEGFLPEIWAYGFRNPWRITFDKEGDQSLYTSDAGQSLWEEVDLVTKAGNYGWNIREGTHCFDPNNPDKSPATCPERGALGEPLINPIIEYGHDLGKVIVGGYIYRGEAMPELQGKYIFADWSNRFAKGNGTLLVAAPSSGGLWKLQEIKIAGRPSGRIGSFIRSLGQDDSGEIYVLTSDMAGPANQTGKVFKIVPA